ncbi:bridge-like lipid transfer protein family member 1 isoform X2 [Macrobrachium nipponense]|uniref:bridge-like lipid transfer protein family member 1 isoform X2 n=1 Tax=Macrobrachium nipponense TaxID=159736 RepID=UPI0030C86434
MGRRQTSFNESLPAFIFDPNLDARQRAKLLEIEMNEQAKTVNDLKMLGASASTIEQEMRRLQELEALVFHDFRRDVMKKLRRQSVKATSMKDRLGLGPKTQLRSKSFKVPSPTIEVKEPPVNRGSHGSIDQASISVDSSPCHTANDPTGQKVKFVDATSQGSNGCHYRSHHLVIPGSRHCRTWKADFVPRTARLLGRIRRHLSYTSGSSDSYPIDDADNSDVFLSSPGRPRTPTPTNVSDTETETMTITNQSSDNVGGVDSRSGSDKYSSGSVPVNESDCRRTAVRRRDEGEYDGSTPGTATGPLSGHSSSHSSGAITPGGLGSSSSGTVKQHDPSIDLELDVRVCISSGMCNLYTRCISRDEEKRMKKERSFSGGISDTPGSPGSVRKKNEGRPNISTGKLRAPPPPSLSVAADTVFYIPGLDVKVHYESHNIHEETPVGSGGMFGGVGGGGSSAQSDSAGWSPAGATGGSGSGSLGATSRKGGIGSGIKRASLFTWLTLQSIQKETTVTPNILEFLEMALEPLPLPEPQQKSSVSQEPEPMFNVEVDAAAAVGGSGVPYVYASFPVDVVVYFHMQPSTIRFSCQPVSRVECLLQLPSLNLVFSSKRAQDGTVPELSSKIQETIGGLSVTGVLEDFSLFVFHPYGGKQRGTSGAPYLGASPLSALTDSERKDSLSVMVEFVKFHISRSRKINFESSTKMKAASFTDSAKANVRFSTIVDVGAAHFKYDMRRLTEILAFPRAWYRRSIVRRLFLGDFTGGTVASDWDETSPAPSASESPPNHSAPLKRQSSSSVEGTDANRRDNGSLSSGSGSGQPTPTLPAQTLGTAGAGSRARDKLRLNFDSDVI